MNTKKKANPQLTQQTEKLTFSLPRDDIGSTWLDVSHTTKLPSKSSTMLSLLLLFQVSSQHLFSFFFFFFFFYFWDIHAPNIAKVVFVMMTPKLCPQAHSDLGVPIVATKIAVALQDRHSC
jgi:hypothetical protein